MIQFEIYSDKARLIGKMLKAVNKTVYVLNVER